jgi:hypothetical protein
MAIVRPKFQNSNIGMMVLSRSEILNQVQLNFFFYLSIDQQLKNVLLTSVVHEISYLIKYVLVPKPSA